MKNDQNHMNLYDAQKNISKKAKLNKHIGGSDTVNNVPDVNKLHLNDVNDLTTDDLYRLADLHFHKKNYIFRHLYDSYNKFLDEDVKNFLEHEDHIFTESMTYKVEDKKYLYYKYGFKFENIRIQEPLLDNGVEQLFPSIARHHNMTYSVRVFADITQYQDTIDIFSDEKITRTIGNKETNILVAIIPLMVRSKWCTLTASKGVDKNECDYDPGGYFLVKGSEKVVICQDRMADNKPLIFIKKDTGLYVQVNSRSYKDKNIIQPLSIRSKKDIGMTVKVPILNEVNVMVLIKALGLESDRNIVNYITNDEHDTDMIDLIRTTLDNCKYEKGGKISTQEDALDYLISKMKIMNKSIESTDKELKHAQKKKFLKNLLMNNLLPHINGDENNLMQKKAFYICHMINRLLRAHLGKIQVDDRDSYINKRIDLVGDLMYELYKQQHKKMMSECKRFFDSRNKLHDNPINIINNIKPNIIEQGINAALSTGNWVRRQGVAQIVQRLSYLYTISLLRRIDAPGSDASTMKLTTPRHLHPSSVGFLCCIETPEHAKIGLTKHLAMISSITIMSKEQYYLLSDYLDKKVIPIDNIPPENLRNYNIYKVFLNGDWLGLTEDAYKLSEDMDRMRREGLFDAKNVSVVRDDDEYEVRVYCDSGRLYRPVLKVDNNIVNLKKSHINEISLDKNDKKKITSWEDFVMKYPDTIDYIDSELQAYVMVSHKLKKVEEERLKMTESIDKIKDIKSNHVENRYDNMKYVKYNYCDIHPSLLIGEIVTNVPFSNMNAGPRNIFQYAQGRQAMCIYSTNYRSRLDISYVLYKPQRPLVHTRSSVYTNSRIIPPGENCLVAIGCYTGYNQEDSLIFNKTSIQRGKFRAMSVKKYILQVQKNQSTAQDDILTKPDPTKVNMKHGTYDKLNDKGYVDPETTIVYGDVIFGKITPVSDRSGTGKPYRDTSEIYKVGAPSIVDRVYLDTSNQDGYEIRKACLRSERVPKVGDKYCCYDNQTEILTENGWKFFEDLSLNDKVATLIDNDTLEYREITDKYEYEHDGEMYKVIGNQVDLYVTMNHRMYIKHENDLNYIITEAKYIVNKPVCYKNNINNYNPISQNNYINGDKFILPQYNDVSSKEILLDNWLILFGILIFEKCMLENFEINVIVKNEDIKNILDNINNSLNFKTYYKSDGNNDILCYTDGYLVNYLKDYILDDNKRFPEWIWNLNKTKCLILINNFMFDKLTQKYNTSSILLADDLQRLYFHAGIITKITTINNENDITYTISINNDNDEFLLKDSVEKYNGKIYCCTVKKDYTNISDGTLYVRRNGIPVWSCNSQHGQKGTVGILMDEINMPYNKQGLKPDIIVNPNAIPSRMTCGQLVECLVGKAAALQGKDADGTPFEDYDFKSVEDALEKLGYERSGNEYLINGMTGEKMLVQYFFGPTYYQRLKHLVHDKIHSRARGPKTSLTHQAPEGRARDGGLRLGEMEKDCLITHGLSKFLKEKLLDNSDAYITYVCDKCGLFAQRFERPENKAYATEEDTYYCPSCENSYAISKVRIPYAFKLFLQELMALNIASRIRCKQNYE
jgi:DNA-directed RNA polymerase II subunit RPB2